MKNFSINLFYGLWFVTIPHLITKKQRQKINSSKVQAKKSNGFGTKDSKIKEITLTKDTIEEKFPSVLTEPNSERPISKLFKTTCHWIYTNQQEDQTKIIIPPNCINRIKDLSHILSHYSNNETKDKNEKWVNDRLSKYIRTVQKQCPIPGWICQEVVKTLEEKIAPKSNIRPKTLEEKMASNIRPKIRDILLNGNVTFFSDQYKIEPLHIEPWKFFTFIEITKVIWDRLNEVLGPNHRYYKHPSNKNQLKEFWNGLSKMIHGKKTTCCGIQIIPTSEFLQRAFFDSKNNVVQKTKAKPSDSKVKPSDSKAKPSASKANFLPYVKNISLSLLYKGFDEFLEAGIYEIYCTVTGKSYIGSTDCLAYRLSWHFDGLEKTFFSYTKLENSALLKDWEIYTKDKFVFTILEWGSQWWNKNLWLQAEQDYINDHIHLYGRKKLYNESLVIQTETFNICKEHLQIPFDFKFFKPAIYRIVCLKNSKCYIGQAENVASRIGYHYNELKGGDYYVLENLQNDWSLYQRENFKFEILELNQDWLNEKEARLEAEKKYIRMYAPNIYNGIGIAKLLTKKLVNGKSKASNATRIYYITQEKEKMEFPSILFAAKYFESSEKTIWDAVKSNNNKNWGYITKVDSQTSTKGVGVIKICNNETTFYSTLAEAAEKNKISKNTIKKIAKKSFNETSKKLSKSCNYWFRFDDLSDKEKSLIPKLEEAIKTSLELQTKKTENFNGKRQCQIKISIDLNNVIQSILFFSKKNVMDKLSLTNKQIFSWLKSNKFSTWNYYTGAMKTEKSTNTFLETDKEAIRIIQEIKKSLDFSTKKEKKQKVKGIIKSEDGKNKSFIFEDPNHAAKVWGLTRWTILNYIKDSKNKNWDWDWI